MTHPNGLPVNGQPVSGQPATAQGWSAARPQAYTHDLAAAAQGGYAGYQSANPQAQAGQAWPQQHTSQPAHASGYTAPVAQPHAPASAQHAGYYAQQTAQPQSTGHFGQQQQPYAYPDTYAQPAPDNRYPHAAQQRPYEPQWPNGAGAQDPRGYDIGSYHPTETGGQGYGDAAYADQGYGQHRDPNHEQGYEGHEDGEYEAEEPKRGSRLTMIAAALVGAIAVGGALAYGYTNFVAPDGSGPTPVVKSAEGPSKTKPADPGGKQFSHSDSKIMGRLTEGGSTPGDTASAGSTASETDSSGARKVQTLVVGRDGSISGPAAILPGMTVVDAFGGNKPPPIETAAVTLPAAAVPVPVVETKPVVEAAAKPIAVALPVKPAVIAKATPPTPTATDAVPVAPAKPVVTAPVAPKTVTAAIDPAAAAPAVKKPAAAPVSTSNSGNGFVAVLASVPVSANSRMSALKQFADMQQKYGTALQSKQPDVQEANLGEKGKYHRLLAGPPGSREQASALCGQLKTQGYGDCWVMAY